MAAFLFHQGTNYEAYRYLGFHIIACDNGEAKAVFRVWAPNAERIFLVGDFNGWEDSMPMQKITENGIYEILIPAECVADGDNYKFKILTPDGRVLYKADPYAFYAEKPPLTASKILVSDDFEWTDSGYMVDRANKMRAPEYGVPINIYEVHPASWKRHEDGSYLSYAELADELIPYVKQMGYTHVEFMPVMEHPFDGSWGYQLTGYYAPTSRFGRPSDFKRLVNDLHCAGIGVILDWVPAHFPKDEHGLCEFDGCPLYEFQGKDRMEHASWGTRKFDVARNEVECFLISNADFWISEYHADGLRVDAVASMLYLDYDKKPGEWNPNIYGGNESLEAIAFFKKLNSHVSGRYPDVLMMAEESTAFASVTKPVQDDGLGFNYKWNMGWMNDTLSYAETEYDYRPQFHNKTNFTMMYAYSERYVLPVSHDEVVHGKRSFLDKMPGDYWRKFAGSRLFLSYMMFHPGKKLTFMGTEIGQFREWDFASSVEWFLLDYEMHKKHQLFVRDLNAFYLSHSQLWRSDHHPDGFRWLRPDDRANSVSSFMRTDPETGEQKALIAVLNFNYQMRSDFIIDVPFSGKYREVFTSDSVAYGGSGALNSCELDSYKSEYGNDLIKITLPPLAITVFELTKADTEKQAAAKYKTALARKAEREKELAKAHKEKAAEKAKAEKAAKKTCAAKSKEPKNVKTKSEKTDTGNKRKTK